VTKHCPNLTSFSCGLSCRLSTPTLQGFIRSLPIQDLDLTNSGSIHQPFNGTVAKSLPELLGDRLKRFSLKGFKGIGSAMLTKLARFSPNLTTLCLVGAGIDRFPVEEFQLGCPLLEELRLPGEGLIAVPMTPKVQEDLGE
jgi:hypothetical protein